MTLSIRTFLLINLLLSVTLITSLAIIGNLFLAHKDIQVQLDSELANTAARIQAFFSDGLNKRDLAIIEQNLKAPPPKLFHNKRQHPTAIEFQIFDKNGNLILQSAHAPHMPDANAFSKTEGIVTTWLNGNPWRVYTITHPHKPTVVVAERAHYRQLLEDKLTQDSILIMLITYPFLGLLIWMVVGRGLSSLKRVAIEVKHRVPSYLEPVGLESVPAEIEPLIIELNSLFKRLKEAFNREKRFTADASHELRTPLAALSTQVQVALRAETNETRNQALLKVLSGVNRSTHVVQQLLTLSRMDPEANLQDPTQVNIAKQAADVAAQLAPEAIAKNIELELLAPESQATITGNATAINILLRNLVDNAIRYSDENGFVKIDIIEKADTVILSVMDNGPGIPKELRERVFERFFRITGTQTTGSGLGLGIVQQIAKLHQSQVHLLTPESGHGLEIQVVFPRRK